MLLIIILCLITTGCASTPTQTDPVVSSTKEPTLSYSLTYYYNIDFNIVNGDYVSQDILQLLNDFGKPQDITHAAPAIETYTEIPEFENNAKGADPVCILLPDLDISKYRICSWWDAETGITTSGWYRIIGESTNGMMTDELITYDVDSEGNITKYTTVNLGKYDNLGLDEAKLRNLSDIFSSKISNEIGTKMFYQYSYTTTSQTTFRLFTDTQDRIIIATTIVLEQNGKPLKVNLYANVIP